MMSIIMSISRCLVGLLPNKALQTDKGNLSCLLHSQKARQLAFAAELGRYASQEPYAS
jgi:hypothetical protein